VEAALLIAAMTLVLVPILYALGTTAYEALSSPCDKLTGENCEQVSSGNGGLSGGMARAESRRTSERWVQANWTDSDGAPAQHVECEPLDGRPDDVNCTVVKGDGSEEDVGVRVDAEGRYTWA
jgi:Flp pilus assembly pilin Flp